MAKANSLRLPNQPIQKSRFNPTKEVGLTGLNEHSGIIQQDFLRELRISGNGPGYKMFDEMRLNSPVIGGLLLSIEQSIRAADWMFTSEEGNEDPRLELLNESLDNMSFSLNDHITEILTMLPFGFSIFEIVYERVGGKMLWRKFGFRGQDTVFRWIMDEQGGIFGFIQQTTKRLAQDPIPIEKLVLYRTKVERNNPEGRSILRTGYTSYYYAKSLQQIEAIGIERDLTGLPVLTMPEMADPDGDDKTEAEEIVRRIRNDEQAGLVLTPGWDFRLIGSESQRLIDVGAVISRYEKRMLMASLAQFLVLGMDQIGALSLSEDQTDFFNMSVNAFADIISDTFTKFVIPRLMKLNGLEADGLRLEHSPAGDVDMEMIAKVIQMAAPFIHLTPEDEVWMRSIFGMPEKTVDEIEELDEKQAEDEQARLATIGANLPGSEQGRQDDMSVDLFATGDPPDDNARKRQESKWRKVLAAPGKFWDKQAGRIKAGALKMRGQ